MAGKKQATIPFVGEAYTLNAPQLSCQTCINMYPAIGQDAHLAKYPAAYFRVPGRTSVHTVSTQLSKSGRWIGSYAGRLFCIIGNGFYEYNTIFDTVTTRGTLSSTSGNVKVLYNGSQLQIIDGAASQVFTLATNVFTPVVDSDFDQPLTGTFQDNYGIYPVPNSNAVMISESNDFLSYIITRRKLFSVEGGNVVAVEANSLDIWVMGQTASEVWKNTGGNTAIPNSTPLERVQGSTIDRGCAAAFSVQKVDNTLIWLSRSKQGSAEVVILNGYQPVVISTEALHQEWNRYDTIQDAVSWSFTYQGHIFYVITFPSANKSYAYDLTTKLWIQIADWDDVLGFVRTGISAFCYHTNNIPYVLAYNSDKIYKLSGDVYDNDGSPAILERTFPTMTAGLEYISYYTFQLDLEKGIGLTTGQGENPQIMLQISRDGGRTWGNELWSSMGKLGQYTRQVKWTRLGTSRNFTPRIRISDPVNVCLFNATAVIDYQDED